MLGQIHGSLCLASSIPLAILPSPRTFFPFPICLTKDGDVVRQTRGDCVLRGGVLEKCSRCSDQRLSPGCGSLRQSSPMHASLSAREPPSLSGRCWSVMLADQRHLSADRDEATAGTARRAAPICGIRSLSHLNGDASGLAEG
jgi:hypothetical protein